MNLSRSSFAVFAIAVACYAATANQELSYPHPHKGNQVDDYHGTRIADPYRWMEDDRSSEVAQWVNAENAVTNSYLARIPYRNALMKRLERLQNYERYTAPVRRGELFFFGKNGGLQNQNVIYVQKGLAGEPRVLLDPNRFSKDGTSRLLTFDVSRDGKYVAYTISSGGSDWQEGHVLETATGQVLSDELKWLKAGGLAWAGGGFFYSRYPAPEPGHELYSKNEFQSVYFHRIGAPQSADELVYEDRQHPLRFHQVETSEDERFAFLVISERGQGKDGNALYYRDLSKSGAKFTPIVAQVSDDRFNFVETSGNKFLIETNWHAPNHRVMAFDPANAASPWQELIPEKPEVLEAVNHGGGKVFAEYLADVKTRVDVYAPEGKLERSVKLPGPGIATGFGGNVDDPILFYSFSSLNIPQTIYRYNVSSGESDVWRSPKIAGFNPDQYESKEVFYRSKDGTRVPMFLVYRKGIKLNGANPTLLYAYGGFNIVTSPTFSPLRLALLEQGFVYASANIRGGGEYGEKWHRAGMKENKQNVFDDFIAAAQYLIDNKYTSREKLAVQGASNGGLLMGAVINQRPDLFRACVAQAGVLDMLRFQKFTIGWNWIADYGSSDNPAEFKALRAYSPLHNIKGGVTYPATLITTADHDDRVVPAHSFKYAATLQEKASHANPVLIRIDTNSGHGPSSTTKSLEQTADIYSFLMYNLGITPEFHSRRRTT